MAIKPKTQTALSECWYCFQPIGDNYIEHRIVEGAKMSTVQYCSKACLIAQIEEMKDDMNKRRR